MLSFSVDVCVQSGGAYAEFGGGALDAEGDLAAVGDYNRGYWRNGNVL